MTTKTCETCQAFCLDVEYNTEYGGMWGYCRGDRPQFEPGGGTDVWPTVDANQWCMQHIPIETEMIEEDVKELESRLGRYAIAVEKAIGLSWGIEDLTSAGSRIASLVNKVVGMRGLLKSAIKDSPADATHSEPSDQDESTTTHSEDELRRKTYSSTFPS